MTKKPQQTVKKANAPRVYGYARISTSRQADDGESLDVQERQITGYALGLGVDVTEIFVERGVSGAHPFRERPAGARLLAVLKPGDMIVTTKLDRMFRSALDARGVLGELRGGGVSLHMIDLGGDVTGIGISKLVFTILSAVAEAERDRTRECITDVKRHQRERRQYLGGRVPFGFRLGDDGALVPLEDQQRAIATMRRLRAEGHSLRAIAEEITGQGVPVSHVSVWNVLRAN
jgi:DNA invertase Pin-like site-specific DNA recombinase